MIPVNDAFVKQRDKKIGYFAVIDTETNWADRVMSIGYSTPYIILRNIPDCAIICKIESKEMDRNMDKNEALRLFYEKNQIDLSRASDENDGNFDIRIAGLSKQIDLWLSDIDAGDHELFLTLLSRFTYLTAAQCQIRYGKILSLLQDKLDRSETELSDVLFVTVESSSAYKSGGDNVRADLHKRNLLKLRKQQIVASQSNLKEEEVRQYQVIVFLNDTVGSGLTLWKEMKNFCDRFAIDGNGNQKLFYSCIAPRKRGMKHLRDNCRDANIHAEPICDPQWYENPAFDNRSADYHQIEKYEQLVGNYLMEAPESFFMGFQRNRLLLAFHYNTPNNTLSTFWRVVPEKNDPPFRRDGNQPKKRPSVNDLKACDNGMRSGAYAYGQDFWRKKENEQKTT